MYHDLTTGNDWPVKEAIVDLPNEMKGNLKRTSGNSLSLLGGGGGGGGVWCRRGISKGDIGQAALQALLTRIRLCLRCRLPNHDLV